MRILFIDDEPLRAKPLLEAGFDVFITDSVQAIELYLANNKWSPFDLVCLDHDFEGRDYDGNDVAREQLAEHSIPVVVHSCNPYGVEDIEATLKEYSIPYTVLPCVSGGISWVRAIIEYAESFV